MTVGAAGGAALAIGVDLGGTKIAAGVVDTGGRILAEAQLPTPGKHRDPAEIEGAIGTVVGQLRAGYDVTAVGVGAAGFVDAERSCVLFAPHLAWRNEPVRRTLSARLGLPVVVENDANAAAWAEHRFGAGRGESQLLVVTLGTGIGGGVVLDGTLQRGAHGLAGEFGHMLVQPGGHRCECGNRGCWEQYASGRALVREARELARSGSPVTVDLVERAGGDPEQLTGPLITAAAQAGDRAAVDLFAEIGEWLGLGLASLAAAYDPGTIVVGGGVSEAGELLLGPARDAFARSLTGRGFRPEPRVVTAELGNRAGLVGAADLARTT